MSGPPHNILVATTANVCDAVAVVCNNFLLLTILCPLTVCIETTSET